MNNLSQINWMAPGLIEAIRNGTIGSWLTKFFNDNEHGLCFDRSEPLAIFDEDVPSVDSFLRSIHITGDDDHRMVFLIENLNGDVLERFTVTEGDCATVFVIALERFIAIINEHRGAR